MQVMADASTVEVIRDFPQKSLQLLEGRNIQPVKHTHKYAGTYEIVSMHITHA